MKYVLNIGFSEAAVEILAKAPEAFRAHRARMQDCRIQGTPLIAGSFLDPGEVLSTMGVFTARDAAEAFARGDPFVRNDMASSWSAREWHDVLAEPAREGFVP